MTWVLIAEIMRRASRAYLNHRPVVNCEKRETTTGTMPVRPHGLAAGIDPNLYGAIAEWYLDKYDKPADGYTPPSPKQIRKQTGSRLYAVDLPANS